MRARASSPKTSRPAGAERGGVAEPGAHRDTGAAQILHLQRTVGNQAVQRLVGTGPPAVGLRAKLKVNEPDDEHEKEADRTADQVMRMPEPSVQRKCDCGGSCPKCSGKQDEEEPLRPKRIHAGSPGGTVAPPIVHEALSSSGQPLSPAVRASMEPRFGQDFGGVRVHTDPLAARSAEAVQAQAYTVGSNVVFGAGRYAPGTSGGDRLIAHELTHVVQQARTSDYSKLPGQTVSSTRAPHHGVQRQLIATGDGAGFRALANSIITVQQTVEVSPAGVVSLRSTSVQGPPTPEQQGLINALQTVINDTNATTIEFIHGASSTRASDARVMIGSYPQSKIDLDDVSAFGTQGSVGLRQGPTAGALLSHEIIEQYRKQIHGEDIGIAHAQGEIAETQAGAGTRGPATSRQISPTTIEISIPYTYPDGRVVEVTWEVVNGNITNLRRRLRP